MKVLSIYATSVGWSVVWTLGESSYVEICDNWSEVTNLVARIGCMEVRHVAG